MTEQPAAVPRTAEDIATQLEAALDSMRMPPGTRWPGMTFEEGVVAALRWVTGAEDEPPMAGEETRRQIRDAKRRRLRLPTAGSAS